jgi:hypothetical protein
MAIPRSVWPAVTNAYPRLARPPSFAFARPPRWLRYCHVLRSSAAALVA